MTNRKLAYIVKDQKPLVLAAHETVQHACRCMRERRAGSVLVIDDQQRLSGIFTGRDAVRTLPAKDAKGSRPPIETQGKRERVKRAGGGQIPPDRSLSLRCPFNLDGSSSIGLS